METTEKKVSHTPGPWTVARTTTHGMEISGSEWRRFARVYVRFEGDDEDSQVGLANAKLIAAAPELLEALKQLIRDSETILDPLDVEELSQPVYSALAEGIKISKQAIKKATL